MQSRRMLSRVVYGSAYLLLYALLVGLLLITPSDAIERSLRNGQNNNVWIVIITVVVTVVIVIFVYVFRLYINKTALASIPKSWVPIEKGDVKDAVYKVIASGLGRSALIAYHARPRVEDNGAERRQRNGTKATRTAVPELGVTLPPPRAVWGDIEHYGWASPLSPDMPNLEYGSVLSELPNLIEGKALALAPASRMAPPDPLMLDPEAVALLQRSPNMGMRSYINHLTDLEVVPRNKTTADFVSLYEYARFSDRPVSNARFREIMHLFAELLRAMQPIDFRALDGEWTAPSESDIDNDAPMNSNPPSPRSSLLRVNTSSTHASIRDSGRRSSAPGWGFPATPMRPTSRQAAGPSRLPSSSSSIARSRRRFPVHQSSSSSLRSKASSSEAGSVIRLATHEDPEALPYVLNLRPTVGSG
ncbi:hypothetical protein HIM_00010 [Hirsutella minnesotensis 3608]|nr:hypothetical protein HIM_00010 [Hirsutella minnesotensis 3608]